LVVWAKIQGRRRTPQPLNMDASQIFLVVLCSYLIGSIPSAYIIGKARGINIFEVGSGNMGATNMARVLGKGWGAIVLFLDSLKGFVAIMLSRYIVDQQSNVLFAENSSRWTATVLAAIFVIVGHNWSIWVTLITGQLRGGKGAATAFGTLITMAPWHVVIGLSLIGAVVIARTRYVSLGALVMTVGGFIWMMILAAQQLIPLEYILYLFAVGLMILWRFRENIDRLLHGKERRFGERA
jgi:acyl phosphate:glycerol-3-phosphate acyltransferase